MGDRPDGFTDFTSKSLSEAQRQFIKLNVPEVKRNLKEESTVYVAMAKVAGSIQEEYVYTNGVLGQGQMKGTIDDPERSAVTNISWYQKTLVFIEQGSGSDLQYLTYTPMLESNLGMMGDGEKNVVFQYLRKGSNGITSSFKKDGDYYWWETSEDKLTLDTDTGNIKFDKSGSLFKFIAPPKFWCIPDGFKPYTELGEEKKKLITNNIPIYSNMKSSLHAARINVRNNEDGDQRLYVELQLEKANLKATTPNIRVDFNEVSWNQYYFVFAEKDEVSFEVFTPVVKQDLGLAIVGKTHSFSPSPPYGWTVFQFIAAGNNYWYWKVEGENLYMYCDPVTADITATDDLSKRSQFRFLYDEEEEDQSDKKPPEQEVGKQEAGEQEAGEQEAGRQRTKCKVQ